MPTLSPRDQLDLRQLPIGPLQTNCYFVGCRQTRQAAIVDPAWNGKRLAQLAAQDGYTITHILLTHAHFDHVGGLAELKAAVGAPIYAHPDTAEMLTRAAESAQRFGVFLPAPPSADVALAEGDRLSVGALTLDVLYTPGHAPGHVSFYLAEQGVVLDGDVLFQGSIGRTDLPGGDFDLLLASIATRLLTLPDETIVCSGHGPATTIGTERLSNPFLV